MELKRLDTTERLSRGIVAGGMLYLSGLTPLDLSLEGIKEQTKALFERCDDLLSKYGTDKEHLVSATIYLKNMEDYNAFNEVWDSWIAPGCAPTRACLRADMASPLLLVEIIFTVAMP